MLSRRNGRRKHPEGGQERSAVHSHLGCQPTRLTQKCPLDRSSAGRSRSVGGLGRGLLKNQSHLHTAALGMTLFQRGVIDPCEAAAGASIQGGFLVGEILSPYLRSRVSAIRCLDGLRK
jgi:hypothetical protein